MIRDQQIKREMRTIQKQYLNQILTYDNMNDEEKQLPALFKSCQVVQVSLARESHLSLDEIKWNRSTSKAQTPHYTNNEWTNCEVYKFPQEETRGILKDQPNSHQAITKSGKVTSLTIG